MAREREVLATSVARLRALVESLSPDDLRVSAYPAEWTVADVLSHLGSGASISTLWVDQALGGPEVSPQPVWDEWNAKDPDAKAADALRADRAYLDRLDALTDAERERFAFSTGPINVGLAGFMRLRLNEHAVHSWDIAVVFDPTATLDPDAAALVFEALPMIAGYAGRPTGATRDLRVQTTQPDADFTISLSPAAVGVSRLEPGSASGTAELALPAEAFVRLVYGRLDPAHTPESAADAPDLDELRRVFPGV